jgi:di/tricarboxylate transporter
MTNDQLLILGILVATVAMFLWGRWRHDMVAVGALLGCVLAGLVSPAQAFTGFGHPAVITVACVLVLSLGLQTSGAVDALTHRVLPAKAGPTLSIAALTALAAVLSGFMNNVGALALLMPVAIQLSARLDLPPGKVLMPLAFGSILGGTTTLIGTPPNLIVSGFRDSAGLGGYGMFAFTPVGLAITAVGVVFIALVGWRLVPARKQAGVEGFETGAYLTEARVPDDSRSAGMTLREIEQLLDETDAQVIGLVRNDVRVTAPRAGRRVRAGDILVIEAEAAALSDALSRLGLKLEEAKETKPHKEEDEDAATENGPVTAAQAEAAAAVEADGDAEKAEHSDDIVLLELAVLPGSTLAGRSASDILLRTRYSINLLAVSRHGQRSMARLRTLSLRPGDLLLMQGPPEAISEFAANFGCVPLAQRELRIPDKRRAILASGIMLLAVATAAFGLLPAAVSFAAGVLASMALRTVPPRAVYDAVDWPVVVLLASLLPVAGAMQATGAADLVARVLLDHIAQGDAVLGLAVILVTTMILTDLMNNAATAAVMAPIGLGAATQLGVNPDTFLMAVAIGASCAFLTPIGHQNNTLILGPGGFRFADYWRMGLPLDAFVIAVALPMLLLVWPL